MKNRLTLPLAVIVALAAGFAAGYLLRPGDTRPAPVGLGGETTPAGAENEGVTDTPGPTKSADSENTTPARPDETPAEPPGGPAPAAGSLAEVLAALETPPIPTGDGEITGEITLEDGSPLPGVKVTSVVSRTTSGYKEAINKGRTVEEHLLEELEVFRLVEATRREVKSDESGHFTLSHLPDRGFNVTFKLEGYRFVTVKRGQSHWNIPPGTRLEMRAIPAARLKLQIEMPDGSLPESADYRKKLISDGPARQDSGGSWSPDYSEIDLDYGRWELTATAGKHDEYASDPVTVELAAGIKHETVVLRLKERNGVVGNLKMPEFYAEAHASIYLAKKTSDELPQRRDYMRHGSNYASAWSSNDYNFAIVGVEPGSYWLVVEIDNTAAHSEAVEIGAGLTRREIMIAEPDRSEYLLVNVLDPQGKPLKEASISLTRQFESGSYGGGHNSRYVDGVYWMKLEDDERRGAERGDLVSVSVRVSHARYGSKEVQLAEGAGEVTVRFEEPAIINVTVSGYSSHPQAKDIIVSLQDHVGGWRGEDRAKKPEGVWKLGPVTPGKVKVSLFLMIEDHESLPLSTTELDAVTGTNELTLQIPSLYTFTLTKADAEKGERASMRPTNDQRSRGGWWSISRIFNEHGEVEFGPVPAGEYEIRTGGRQKMHVTLPGPARVEFKAMVVNALKVTIDKEEGYFAKVGFQTGDLIIGVDNEEFTDEMQMQASLMGAFTKEKAKLLVQRAGTRFEIEIEGKVIRDESDREGGGLGASLDGVERK